MVWPFISIAGEFEKTVSEATGSLWHQELWAGHGGWMVYWMLCPDMKLLAKPVVTLNVLQMFSRCACRM